MEQLEKLHFNDILNDNGLIEWGGSQSFYHGGKRENLGS